MKHIEFSKIILIAAGIINTSVVIFTMVMVAITKDTTALCYLIPSVATEVATGTGFYYSKAKVENRIKLMLKNGLTPQEGSYYDS